MMIVDIVFLAEALHRSVLHSIQFLTNPTWFEQKPGGAHVRPITSAWSFIGSGKRSFTLNFQSTVKDV